MVSRIAVELAFCEQVIALYMIDSEKKYTTEVDTEMFKRETF